MKIGLCCCYANHNYGSVLQSLANLHAVRMLGNDCEILRYVKNYTAIQKIRHIPRILNGANIKSLKQNMHMRRMLAKHPDIARNRDIRKQAYDAYINNVFSTSVRTCSGFECLKNASDEYDAVMVGSDQLWLPAGLPTNFYNLQFAAPGIRRISYATSFGVSSVPWYQRRRTADYLQRVDFLSVREDTGAEICRSVAGVEAKVVVDPTLLLTRTQWAELIPEVPSERQPYIFCYFLGNDPFCRNEANRVSVETGLPIVTLRHLDEVIPSDESFGTEAPYDVDPAAFVNLIRNAQLVLTDSFHGTVFSTIHHKRFATFYRFRRADGQSRNSRIDSLLAHLGTEDRLVTEASGSIGTLARETDYAAVDQRLAEWRAGSWDFLEEALS